MACGLPCIATAVGGNQEAVADGSSGFLVPADSPEPAASRILELLRNPERARMMGQTGRDIVHRRFSSAKMGHRLVALYDELLAGASEAPVRPMIHPPAACPARVPDREVT